MSPSETDAPTGDRASATFYWDKLKPNEGVVISIRVRGRNKKVRVFNFHMTLIIPISVEINSISERSSPEKEAPLVVTYTLKPVGLAFTEVSGEISDPSGEKLFGFPDLGGRVGENLEFRWEYYDSEGETVELPREVPLSFKVTAVYEGDVVEAVEAFTVEEAELIELTHECESKTGYEYVLL